MAGSLIGCIDSEGEITLDAERIRSAPCRRLGGRLCRAGRGVVRGWSSSGHPHGAHRQAHLARRRPETLA